MKSKPGGEPRNVKFIRHNMGGYATYRGIQLFTRFCPLRLQHGFAGLFMAVAARLTRRIAADVAENYRNAFPELGEDEIRRLVIRMYCAYGRGVIDFWQCALPGPQRIGVAIDTARVRYFESRRPGLIFVTAHAGNFEAGGLQLAAAGVKLNIIGLPELDGRVDAFRRDIRIRYGIRMLPVGSAMQSFFKLRSALERGESAALAADRPLPKDSVEVSFFGRPTRFLKTPAMLAGLTGAPVVPVFFMEDGPRSYRAIFGEEIFFDATLPSSEAARVVMQRVATAAEEVIRRYPEQWYNFYPYWRQPLGEAAESSVPQDDAAAHG